MQSNDSTVIGTIGGTLLTIFSVNANTLINTIIVAIVGATTSFLVSLFLKWSVNKIKNVIKK